jgi:hypothetical protein
MFFLIFLWQMAVSFHKENCHPANEFILLYPMSSQGSFENGVVVV